MTLKKSSRNNGFMPMFKESMRKSCFFPILLFVLGGMFLISYIYDKLVYVRSDPNDFFLEGVNMDVLFFANVILILGAVVSAISIFGFQWSRKYSNVIYSFGMRRSNIFLSKILGGLVPMIGSIVTLLGIAIISDAYFNCEMNAAYWKERLYLLVSMVAVYTLAYVLCSVVFVNVGNAVEAIIFTPILALFPTVLSSFVDYCKIGYTLGGNLFGTRSLYGWNEPFFLHMHNGYSVYGVIFGFRKDDLIPTVNDELTFVNFICAIFALAYAIIIFALGYHFFKKSKNDYSGSWGRTKGIAEIVGAVVGFYAFSFTLYAFTLDGKPGNENVITFISCCAAFLLAQIIFKLVFSSKRKVAVKKTLNRFPAYAAVFGAVTLVYTLGLFGYSSYIPEASEIKKVMVGSLTYSHNDYDSRGTSFYALNKLSAWKSTESLYDEDQVMFTDADEIGEIRKLHKTIITDGKIKNSADDACSARIDITYTLKNGKVVVRSYYESTLDTTKKILKLNDLETVKEHLKVALSHGEDTVNKSVVQDYFIEAITIDNESNFVYRKSDGTQVGYIERIYNTDIYENETYLHFMDDREPVILEDYNIQLYSGYQNVDMLFLNNCYLFPKDMSKGFDIGLADEELLKALKTDILAQTTEQYYMHRPEDEIGILSFGLSYTERDEQYDYDEYGNRLDENGEMVDVDPENTSWNIFSTDIKAIVVTKDMKNTIKYLESHDLMKHFENSRKVKDIKAIKVATSAELYGSRTLSDNIPLFAAGYWTSETVRIWNKKALGWTPNYFGNINNKFTDVETITKLVDSSMLFGFCGNDDKILEIEYTDGSLATVIIPADVYKNIK